ncbi:MAG: Sua5/YciO/YrdC/YwlC family protein, partial [Deltaproteobacteria bacterium]|nr:Sua5/YciO/YrdC/YwlC family protein [Deltaproteobacteria bacterium]
MDRHLGGSPGGEAVGVSASGRIRLEIQGTVQGVGFRPFVHRLAGKHALGGFVNNGGRGVLIELEGPPEALEGFLADFKDTLPPLARVERLVRSDIQPRGERGFRIEASDQDGDRFTLISPDIATCPACLEELEDPADRRFGYAFINCTDCGPRFTIIRDIPYDREKTTMAGFVLCPACLEEYRDPERRRFHAEPVACPACGPRLSLLDSRGRPVEGDPLEAAAGLLAQGQVLAIKGLGGFHLACDPFSETAVGSLRSRKHREDKPFAIMARDLDAARELCAISPDEEDLLLAPERPIVLLRRRESSAGGAAARLAHGVAPGFRELGV